MLNQLTLLKGERSLATMLAERDQVIEGLCQQIDQMTDQITQLQKELSEVRQQAETPCQKTPNTQ